MKGIVTVISPNRGKYIVKNEQEKYIVFELINSTSGVEIGDEIVGPLNSYGTQELGNISRAGKLNVSIIDICPTESKAKKLLR